MTDTPKTPLIVTREGNMETPTREQRMMLDDTYVENDDAMFDDDDGDPFDELDADCGLGPDGQCSKAGSEECDFECPNRNSEDFCGSEAWKRKHAGNR